MSLNNEEKVKIIKQYGASEQDTGSSEVQIALLTADIEQLTGHFKAHTHDHHSRRGLLRKVNLRRKLLSYLRAVDVDRYHDIVKKLKLRG